MPDTYSMFLDTYIQETAIHKDVVLAQKILMFLDVPHNQNEHPVTCVAKQPPK